MSGYLEAYGAAEQKRANRLHLVKNVSMILACVLVVGLILYGIFKNYGEEHQAKTFVAVLAAHDYKAAYAMWGCTDSHPCTEYPFNKFMDDWGPKSAHADEASAHIGLSQSCGSGVVIRLDYKGSEEAVPLWVERDTGTISFAPYPECPGRHLHLGAWFKSLFGG
ncbi:MAG TPA: hypothetical protein VMU80_20600 [Bryobacteraceae bacterium]|nr:hypothetical protein [Bryobacteraceae bacterium]HUO31634.1 hypothetical protein [Bryobacteraceae bacterium]